jgi:hypothetical protein
MKIKATISAEVEILDDDDFIDAQERALKSLYITALEWVSGELEPKVNYSLDLPAEKDEIKTLN